jgi:hypothetical protein
MGDNSKLGAYDSEPRHRAYQILEEGAETLVGGRHYLPQP